MAKEIKNLNQRLFTNLLNTSKIDTVIIPLGSIEQHGAHLPFSTDTIIVEYISKIIAQKKNAFLLPSLYYGVSFEHEPFFNVSISYNILINFISDICISLFKQGINNIYVINGHHGNIGLLQYVGQHISTKYSIKGKFFYYINYWQILDRNFDHAGEVETSLMLVIGPDLVRMDLIEKGLELVDDKNNQLHKIGINMSINNPGGFIKFTKNGIWGNPINASYESGKKMLSTIIEKIIILISEEYNK
jgi:creatinine amidohydrolase